MKKELRLKYRSIRKSININNELIQANLYKLFNDLEFDKILIYVSNKEEVDTYGIIDECFKLNKKVYVPKCIDNSMSFYQINSINDLELGSFNIYEPITNIKLDNFDNSICIVPGIVFDNKGNRIGYGKGYYDRFLVNYHFPKIGLTVNELLIYNVYPDKYDIKVDYIVTEDKIKKCK